MHATKIAAEDVIDPKPTLGERGLNRFFLDGTLGAGFMRDNSSYLKNKSGIILNFRIGNNFYLGKGNNPMIIRLTYFRIGFTGGGGGIYPLLVTPQLGLAKHFRLNEIFSIEPGVHAGYIFNSDFPFGDIETFGFGVLYEIKFNFSRFALGIEYGTRKNTHEHPSSTNYNSYERRYHYIGFSIGSRIGRGMY